MMKSNEFYQHDNNTDVAIHVVEDARYVPEAKAYDVYVNWVNVVNPNNPHYMWVSENIRIKEEDLDRWKRLG